MRLFFQKLLAIFIVSILVWATWTKAIKAIKNNQNKNTVTIEYDLPFENYTPVISAEGTYFKISLEDYYEIVSTGKHFVKPTENYDYINIESYLIQDGVVYFTTLAEYKKPDGNLFLHDYKVIDGALEFNLVPSSGPILYFCIILIVLEVVAGWFLVPRIIKQFNERFF